MFLISAIAERIDFRFCNLELSAGVFRFQRLFLVLFKFSWQLWYLIGRLNILLESLIIDFWLEWVVKGFVLGFFAQFFKLLECQLAAFERLEFQDDF